MYPVVETHNEYATEDLRLLEPFPGLCSIYDILNFDELCSHDRRSVPWPLIVMHFHRKLFPNKCELTAQDRDAIKKEIREISKRDSAVTQSGDEMENFQQAIKGLNAALTAPQGLPEQVKIVLSDKKVDDSKKKFWLMCAGLKKFVGKRSEMKYPLPLRGTVPDISASTVRFVSLQEAYRKQAEADAKEVYELSSAIAKDRNIHTDNFPTLVDVQLFCRNSAFLTVLHGVSLESKSCF